MSTDDESFHPLGQEWETELEGMLDDTEYDSDLGMEMAQDAMRVTKGELSEAEFHDKYHEDVMDEFGVDDRPTEEAYEQSQEEEGTMARMLSAFDGDGEESRRDAMKKMGAGAAAVGLGAWGTVDDTEPSLGFSQEGDDEGSDDDGVQWGMAIDLEQCDGCLSCMQACAEENNLDQGVNWMYVLEYEDESPETGRTNRLVRPCQHCTDAPCEKVCPTTARHTRESDGLVLTDYDVCIGCRYCQVACPYGVNYFQWDEPDVSTDEIAEDHAEMDTDHMTSEDRWVDSRAPRGTMSKCTMCPTRQDGDMGEEMVGTTACQEECPPDAINFGNMNEETSDPQLYAANPSRTRTLADLSLPSADDLEEALSGEDDDIETVLDAYDFAGMNSDISSDDDGLALLLATAITAENDLGAGSGEMAAYEEDVEAILETLTDHGLDLESQTVLAELGLAAEPAEDEEDEEDEEFDGPDEEAAQLTLDQFAGDPGSSYHLLEDMGTNPNIAYFGNEPGPNAEQREPTGSGQDYENVSYARADGDRVNLVDNRKEVLDDETVGDFGVSL